MVVAPVVSGLILGASMACHSKLGALGVGERQVLTVPGPIRGRSLFIMMKANPFLILQTKKLAGVSTDVVSP